MADRTKLSDAEIDNRLADLPGWAHENGQLRRTFEFSDFVEAFGFMSSAALIAERMAHHPNWSNVYKTVEVGLNTHDVGGITALDFELATAMSKLAG